MSLSRLSSTPYRSLSSLTALHAYTILRIEENQQGFLNLYLRGSAEEGEFKPLFLLPFMAKALLKAAAKRKKLRNGEDSPLYLVFTGVYFYAFPLLEVSGEGFTQRLH